MSEYMYLSWINERMPFIGLWMPSREDAHYAYGKSCSPPPLPSHTMHPDTIKPFILSNWMHS
jgi:hypothetical protein